MTLAILRTAALDPELHPLDVRVLALLVTELDVLQYTSLKQIWLANRVHSQQPTIHLSLDRLCSRGYLQKDPDTEDSGDGRGIVGRYRVRLAPFPASSEAA